MLPRRPVLREGCSPQSHQLVGAKVRIGGENDAAPRLHETQNNPGTEADAGKRL